MGLAGGAMKYAMGILAAAEKQAKDTGTKDACQKRQKIFKEEYDEVALQCKNVYYEQDSDPSAV